MGTQSWQHDITTAAVPAPDPVDLEEYVRAVFDGAIGDCELPFRSQPDAIAAVTQLLEARGRRSLTKMEEVRVGVEVTLEWNRRRIATDAPKRLDSISFAAVVGALRDLDRCADCGKTRAVMNVATRGFRAERITADTHCSCIGGPAHIGAAGQERAS